MPRPSAAKVEVQSFSVNDGDPASTRNIDLFLDLFLAWLSPAVPRHSSLVTHLTTPRKPLTLALGVAHGKIKEPKPAVRLEWFRAVPSGASKSKLTQAYPKPAYWK